jgi:hypothetical protein
MTEDSHCLFGPNTSLIGLWHDTLYFSSGDPMTITSLPYARACFPGSTEIHRHLAFDGNTDVDAIERVEPSEVRTG